MSADPENGMLIGTTAGEARIVTSAKLIEASLWKDALSDHCLDARYFEVVEETLRDGFDYRYAILANEHTGQTAVQPFFLVDQDITAGLPKRVRAAFNLALRPFPRLAKIKTAIVGCAAGEGQLDCVQPWALQALDEAVGEYARRVNARMIVFKDLPFTYRNDCSVLMQQGYKRIPSMPGAKLDLDFSSFDEYLHKRLGPGYRRNLKRKFRDSARFGPLWLEVLVNATPYAGEILALYLQTYQRSEFRFERLTAEYFSRLGQRMPDRARFFLWRHEGRIIAFALCLVHAGVMHSLNIGLDYAVALKRHLYFEVWRDLVSWAIEEKLDCIQTGPLNYDPKFRLRLKLYPLDLYVRHTSPIINPVLRLGLNFLQPARHDPTLSKFPNAGELL